MKRKLLLTFALSTMFASSQLAFLPIASAHAAANPTLSVSSSATTVRGGNLEALLSKQTSLKLGNSEGLTDIQELGNVLGIKI